MQKEPANTLILPDVYGKNVAFDLDGTLVEGDCGDSVFYCLMLAELNRLKDIEESNEIRLRWEEGHLARILSRQLAMIEQSQQTLNAYKLATRFLEHYPAKIVEDTVKGLLNSGRQPKRVNFIFEWPRHVRRTLALHYGARFYPQTASLVAEIQARGGIVWVVSASPQKVVEGSCDLLGIPRQRALGTVTLSAGSGFMRFPWAETKVEVLRAAGVFELELAFGNSNGDLEMLQLAKQAAVVESSAPEVLQIARQRGWHILRPGMVLCWDGKGKSSSVPVTDHGG